MVKINPPTARSQTSSTSATPNGAAISQPGRSQSSSQRNFVRPFDPFANHSESHCRPSSKGTMP